MIGSTSGVGPDLAAGDAGVDGVADDLSARGWTMRSSEQRDQPRDCVAPPSSRRAGQRHVEVAPHVVQVGDEVAAGVAGVRALGRVAEACRLLR